MPDPFADFIEQLSSQRRVLITTHVRPDGDALGTTAALQLALTKKQIAAEVLLLSPLPNKYSFLYKNFGVAFSALDGPLPADFSLAKFDTLLVADTGTWSQLPGLRPHVEAFKGKKLVLDHHLTQEDWADAKLVKTTAAAATEIAAELIERWEITLDKQIATALFVGLVTDTGWFAFSSTSPHTHRLAARLQEQGVDADALYQLIFQNERAERLFIQGKALETLQLSADGRIATMMVSRDAFTSTGGKVNDTEGLVNLPLQLKTVDVSVLLTDPPEGGPIRISLRSKGAVDVARFAEPFGGGGHARAAGIKLDLPLTAARDRVAAALKTALVAAVA